tara:strand:+ start:301 stop:618 length:318 start_codon:yes stop_codon:yes gene_type:complete
VQRSQKPLDAKKNEYYADKLVIDTIFEIVSNEPLEPTELITRVREETNKSKAQCREIVDRYEGKKLDEFIFWRIETVAHDRKALELPPIAAPKYFWIRLDALRLL